jgi:predicted nucleic acid-binding protein
MPSNENTLSGTVSLDASALIELLSGTAASTPLQAAIENDRIRPHTTYLALSESEYILCRELGEENARQKVDSLIQSRTIEIVEDSFLLHDAARVKCGRAIALGDCYTIALAQKLKGTALFAHPEEDLDREKSRKPFPVTIVFLQSDRKSPRNRLLTRKGSESLPSSGPGKKSGISTEDAILGLKPVVFRDKKGRVDKRASVDIDKIVYGEELSRTS